MSEEVFSPIDVDPNRFRDGDRATFERLFRLLWREIYRMTYRLLLSHDDAEEAAQEAFVRAHAERASFRGDSPESLRAWIRRIAWRAGLDLAVRRGKTSPMTEDLVAESDGPADRAISREAAGDVRAALSTLSFADRTALVLFEMEGVSIREIAETLRSSEAAIKVRLHRARRRFREAYRGARPGESAA